MRALVTGASGQLGRALLARTPTDWTCVALNRSELDLTNTGAIRAAIASHAPDVVLNAAAYTAVDRAECEESLAFAVNEHAVRVMADSVQGSGALLVHVSTDFVFDGLASRAYLSCDPRAPMSVYGRSKAAGEVAAGPDAAIVRSSWVYGAGGTNFVTTMLRLMRTRDEVQVVADQIGAPTWVAGLADVVWSLALRRLPGIYHHCDAGVASWYDFAVAIQEEARALGLLPRAVPIVPIETADYPTQATRPRFSLLDTGATRAALGRMPVHWRTNLRRMLAEQHILEGGG